MTVAYGPGNSGIPQVKMAFVSCPVGDQVNRIIRPSLSPVPTGGPIVLVNDSAARRDGSTANTPTTARCARSLIVAITRWPDLRSVESAGLIDRPLRSPIGQRRLRNRCLGSDSPMCCS